MGNILNDNIITKSFDLAKAFVEKLVFPSVEETGLLLKDTISLWRFNNQIRILNKAQAICVKNDVSIKKISLKTLVPLLENASMEEEEELQDVWSKLIVNLVDSDFNIENNVFPFILSQLSKNEYNAIKKGFKRKLINRAYWRLDAYGEPKKFVEEYKNVTSAFKWNSIKPIEEYDESDRMNYKYYGCLDSIFQDIELYEIENLKRLGLIRHIHSFNSGEIDDEKQMCDLLGIKEFDEFVLSQMGEIFVSACLEKTERVNTQ